MEVDHCRAEGYSNFFCDWLFFNWKMVILLQKTLLLFPPQFEPFPQRSAARHDTRCSTRCLGHIFCYVAQMSKMAIHGPKVTIWTLVLKIRWPLTTCFNQISMFNSINSCLESWKANHLQPLVGIQKCVTCKGPSPDQQGQPKNL